MGKSHVPRPKTHRPTADMPAIGGRAKKKLRRRRPMERQKLKGQGFFGLDSSNSIDMIPRQIGCI
jgi:hypothetical protein